MTNGAVIAPDSASVNLNSTTKARIRTHSRTQEIAERADRGFDDPLQRHCAVRDQRAAGADFSGSVAISVVIMPMTTSDAIAT